MKASPEEIEVDYIIIHSGERYDFLLDTTKQSSNNYWIVACRDTAWKHRKALIRDRGYNCSKARRAYARLHYITANNTTANDTRWPPLINYDPTKCCNSSSRCYAANCPFEESPDETNITCLNAGNFTQRQIVPEEMFTTDKESVFLNFGFGGDETVAGSSINGRHFQFPPSPPTTQYSDVPEDFQEDGNLYCEYP